MEANKAVIKEKIVAVLQELPAEKMIEILDFAAFVRQSFLIKEVANNRTGLKIMGVPATGLRLLTGIIAWGGDAVVDSDRLYE